MHNALNSLKVLPGAYIQFDLTNTLLHFQPVKVSLGMPLQGLRLNIVLFLGPSYTILDCLRIALGFQLHYSAVIRYITLREFGTKSLHSEGNMKSHPVRSLAV